MGSRYITEAAEVLRGVGLTVIEQNGWQTRARSSGGYADPLGPVCVMWHHTASSGDPKGQTDYMSFNADARPLANIAPAPNGDIWLLAAGATNTNGSGGPLSFSRGQVPVDGMNSRAWGMEIMNNGVGQAYPQAQIDAAFLASNTLNKLFGNQPSDVANHSLWAPGRKIDCAQAHVVQGPWRPRGFNGATDSWVNDDLVAECLRRAGSTPPDPPQPPFTGDTDMARLIIQDTRNGGVYVSDGVTKTWIFDGNLSAQLNFRVMEAMGKTPDYSRPPDPLPQTLALTAGVAIDGFHYAVVTSGDPSFIASYGPFNDKVPAGMDRWGL